jgi:hypothetical protein
MRSLFFAACFLATSPACAEVISADPHGFEVQHSVNIVIPVPQAYAAFGRIGAWWSPDHTYSKDAGNLRFALQPGGCFCEAFPKGGGVEHLRVALVKPNEEIVLTGSLGPLLYQAASSVMDVRFERTAGGAKVTLNYRAAGFAKGDADKLAPLVDGMLSEQVKRYRAYAARGGGK